MTIALCLVAIAISSHPLCGAAPKDGALERPGDGSPVCGLGVDFHAERRAELRRRLEKDWIFVRGLPKERDARAFRQDKQFWYLTGIESPDAALLMNAGTGEEILFLADPNPFAERWDGELWDSGDEWVRSLTGFEDVRPGSKMLAVLGELLEDGSVVWTSSHPVLAMAGTSDYAAAYDRRQAQDPLDGRRSRADTLSGKLVELFGVVIRDFAPVLVEMRWAKTPAEVLAMRRAGRAGALAMTEAIRSTRPGVGEWELDALMSYEHVRHGASGPAYSAIVGSGTNSCILHYTDNDRRMKAGEVVLVDYGCEVDHYTTDITRTWPVDGEFSELAGKMYDAVLAAQEAGIAAVRPGKTMADVDEAASAVLRERGYGDLILHGTCHWIGMEVHDPGPRGDGDAQALVPGVAFTVEPGIYDEKTGIGIRIEDVVVVTEGGCEVITAGVPKARSAVEALVRERGTLDPVAGDR